MDEFGLHCADRVSSITHTYVRDDGVVTSWPDHFLVSQALVDSVHSIHTLQVGCNLSDHLPLFATLDMDIAPPCAPSTFFF